MDCPETAIIIDIATKIALDPEKGLESALKTYEGNVIRHVLIHPPCVEQYEQARKKALQTQGKSPA